MLPVKCIPALPATSYSARDLVPLVVRLLETRRHSRKMDFFITSICCRLHLSVYASTFAAVLHSDLCISTHSLTQPWTGTKWGPGNGTLARNYGSSFQEQVARLLISRMTGAIAQPPTKSCIWHALVLSSCHSRRRGAAPFSRPSVLNTDQQKRGGGGTS
jgi:hypothetical protein